jgi:flagellar biosynthesis/type III secretory pathway protein FliH
VILAALPPPLREELRMQGYVYQSEFARKYYSEGREKGLEEGHEKGLEKGLEEGHEKGLEKGVEDGLRSAVFTLLQAKLDAIAPDDRAAIEAMRDTRALTELIDALIRATGAAEVRAALAALRARP